MSILKYKYKAHKLINYAFYVVVFVVGFIMGFGAKEINFNKLISQVLMIDSVEATTYTFPVNNSYKVTSTNYYNEEFLYNFFNYYANETGNLNLSFANYKYVYSLYNNSTHSRIFYCPSPREITRSDEFYFTDLSGCFGFDFTSNNVEVSDGYSRAGHSKSSYYLAATEDYSSVYGTKFKKLLDFSDYTLKLEFNENLFKDNPDFKEVCVEEGKSFAITSTQMSDINSVYDYDYFWLPYNLNGISKILYDNSVETNEIHYTEEEAKERYFYNNKENIDNFYSNDIPGLELEIKGYTDKYSYYGWSAWPFRVYYSELYNQYNIFTIEDPTKIYVGNLNEDGNVHGGGGLRLDGDEEIEISSNYCFYIKNIYEVTYINIDEWGDYHGTVPTPNGDYEFSTSHNKLNSNTDSFLNQPIKFINSMKDTINLINSLIYEFYISLPTLIRTFIITVLIILLIMLIMSIGGYK